MRFLVSCLLAAAAALFTSAPVVQARERTFYWTSGDYVCDIRNCGATAFSISTGYGAMAPTTAPEELQFWGPVRLINGQYPGPLVDVYEGETIRVRLNSQLGLEEPTSIHWHGMFQRGTDFMDGVTWISQCPIEEGDMFEYKFRAEPAGSHWYHSHAGIEAIEGIAGALIVRRFIEPMNKLYNIGVSGTGYENDANPFDDITQPKAERILAITQLWASTRIMHLVQDGLSILNLNGRFQDGSAAFPWQQVSVSSAHCYRFRLMYLDASDNHGTAIKISIQNHPMKVIELDGIPNDPVDAKSVKMVYAQRTDVVVCPRAGKMNYWINFEVSESNNFYGTKNADFKAILSVDGAATTDAFAVDDPTTLTGAVDHDFLYGAYTLTYSKLPAGLTRSFLDHIGFEGITAVPEATHTVEMSLGYRQGDLPEGFAPLSAQMWMANFRKFMFPSTPLTVSEKCAHPDTHNTMLPYDAVVDIVFNNMFNAIHPMHLHGGAFWVLGSSETVGEGVGPNQMLVDTFYQAKCPQSELQFGEVLYAQSAWGCKFNPDRHYAKLNTVNPPIRDTAALPPHGWLVIRWRTNNPGYWFFHCHTEAHMADGMLHVFTVAPEMREPTPVDFPQCGPCRTDRAGWEVTLGDSAPAMLTAHGKTVFPAPASSGNDITSTTNVYCNNEEASTEGNARVNVNFQNMLNGFGAKTN